MVQIAAYTAIKDSWTLEMNGLSSFFYDWEAQIILDKLKMS